MNQSWWGLSSQSNFISLRLVYRALEKLVWESGPGLELGPGPRCLNPEVINGRIVIISDQLTISRDRDQEHISFLHGYNSQRNELSTECGARSGEILL